MTYFSLVISLSVFERICETEKGTGVCILYRRETKRADFDGFLCNPSGKPVVNSRPKQKTGRFLFKGSFHWEAK